MIEQFRQRYPLASLTSELLKTYHGKYLVRASIQVDGVILSTGMGEGETIEQAEDSARTRAIAALALDSNTFSTAIPTKTPQKPTPASPPQPIAAKTPAAPPTPSMAPPAIPEESKQQPPKPVEPLPANATSAASTPPMPPETELAVAETLPLALETTPPTPPSEPTLQPTSIETAPAVTIATTAAATTPSVAMAPAAPLPIAQQSVNAPIDFSEIIAQSDVELKRLGWDSEQGRNYLLETYGKRSRQLLSDEELIEFLQHLQSLPSPVAS